MGAVCCCVSLNWDANIIFYEPANGGKLRK